MHAHHPVATAIAGILLGVAGWVALAAAVSPPARSEPPMRTASRSPLALPGQTPARYSKSAHDITPLTESRIDQLAQRLTPEQREIILKKGTEPSFCGTLLDNKKSGIYTCALCDLPLFSSGHKFDSGTGWPSFFSPVDPDHVATHEDNSYGMRRVEITCARCGGHLGHVFDDGPKPTGLRFCVNSESLNFTEDGHPLPAASKPVATADAYFAGGCFWGVEHHFESIPGVIDAVSGFQGGTIPNPTYKQVCTEGTGYAETVKVTFDPARVSYRHLLRAFFAMHDPTQLNRQGPDIGTQYRSAVFAADDAQLNEARAYLDTLAQSNPYRGTVVTELLPAAGRDFYPAEEYHQDYIARTGRACHTPRPITDLPE